MSRIVVPCVLPDAKTGEEAYLTPSGRHRWDLEVFDFLPIYNEDKTAYAGSQPLWDNRCRRCRIWYVDAIEH